ncbi:hypothetical protein chiPu_0017163 [Chiloscyllium punctatum]|uniref:Uncharacterized protein n=1 Tax=Chiloscyllium punctatum TaxID=137246 RepID=A0A401T7N6_CHIPU|nr:hypothetical protein [Chiloscyllium punctatum]
MGIGIEREREREREREEGRGEERGGKGGGERREGERRDEREEAAFTHSHEDHDAEHGEHRGHHHPEESGQLPGVIGLGRGAGDGDLVFLRGPGESTGHVIEPVVEKGRGLTGHAERQGGEKTGKKDGGEKSPLTLCPETVTKRLQRVSISKEPQMDTMQSADSVYQNHNRSLSLPNLQPNLPI